MQAAKTDEERKYISRNFALQCALVRAQVLNLKANAYSTRMQGDLWNPAMQGALWRGATVDANVKASDWNLRKRYAKEFDENFYKTLITESAYKSDRLRHFWYRNDSPASSFFHLFDEFKGIIPFSSAFTLGN